MTLFQTIVVDAGCQVRKSNIFFQSSFRCQPCLYDIDISLGLYDADISLGLYDESSLSMSLWRSNKLRSLWRELRRVLTKRNKMTSLARQLWRVSEEKLTRNLYFVMYFVTSSWNGVNHDENWQQLWRDEIILMRRKKLERAYSLSATFYELSFVVDDWRFFLDRARYTKALGFVKALGFFYNVATMQGSERIRHSW